MHLTAGILPLLIVLICNPFSEAFGPRSGSPALNSVPSWIVGYGSSRWRRWQASVVLDFESEDDNDDDDDKTMKKRRNEKDQDNIVVFFDAPPIFNHLRVPSKEPTSPSISKWKQQLENSRPPPLTSIKRARMEKEIDLLQQLVHGNDAATELSNLWINERGPRAAKGLQMARALVQRGLWQQAEQMLVSMIEEEGVHFLAPVSQLAQLYAKQGRLGDAKQLYELVLSQKPWYLDSLLGIHEVCKKLDNHKELVKWDRELIPFLENRSNREAWVRRMVTKAKEMLNNSGKELQYFFYDYYNSHGSEGSVIVDEETSWQ